MLFGCFAAVNKMSRFFESIANLFNKLLKNVSRYIARKSMSEMF